MKHPAQIRRFGYSHRITFANFIQRYSILVYPVTMDLPLTRETCENILQKLNMQNWTIGKSKVFLKYYHAEELSRLYGRMLKAIVTIQSTVRMVVARRRLRHPNRLMIDELHRHPKFSRLQTDQEENKSIVLIQSCVRGHLQRLQYRRLMKKPRTEQEAAILIQKTFRGYRFRKAFSHYRQRLDIQTLCFLQQIELINQDFYTKIVRTNYCVSSKSIDTTLSHLAPIPPPPAPSHFVLSKQVPKSFSYLFPPPPPLPLPSPLQTDLSSAQKSCLSPPSPLLSTSKFAQVRDLFARSQPMKNAVTHQLAQSTLAIESSGSPKTSTVLSAVQEYQRQHINSRQIAAAKRFAHLGTPNNRSRSVHPVKSVSTAKQDLSTSTSNHHPFQVSLRKTGQDLFSAPTLVKRSTAHESKQIDFRSVLKSRHTLNGTSDNEIIVRSNSLSQPTHLEHRLRFHDI